MLMVARSRPERSMVSGMRAELVAAQDDELARSLLAGGAR